jgi:hypothetical protein
MFFPSAIIHEPVRWWVAQEKQPQVPPLRSFGAPVGMTIFVVTAKSVNGKYLPSATELSSRPELRRSVVEGPAVASPERPARSLGCSLFSIERSVKRLPFPLTSAPATILSFPCRSEHTTLFLRNSFQLD